MQVLQIKEAVKKAFKALRKQNLLCRMNFSCCSGCAGYALAEMMKEKKENGKPLDGAVFYHRQDNDALLLNDGIGIGRRRIEKRCLHIRYGTGEYCTNYTEENEDVLDVEIGKKVVAALEAEGLKTKWSGSADETIQIEFEV